MLRLWLVLLLPFAFLAAAVGAITMGPRKGTWLPVLPTVEELQYDMPPLSWRTANHWLKNIAVECVRKDPHWWAKALSLALLLAIIN